MLVLAFGGSLSAGEIVKIKLSDGETLTGKLELPADSSHIQRLIIYIPGTGPSTYLTRRKIGNLEFNYYDLFTQEITKTAVLCLQAPRSRPVLHGVAAEESHLGRAAETIRDLSSVLSWWAST